MSALAHPLSHAPVAGKLIKTASPRTHGLRLQMILEILSKTMEMVRAVPQTGCVTPQQMDKLRAIADTL